MMDIGKEKNNMTGEEILRTFNELRAEGKTDEEIKMTLFRMFRANEFGAYEFYQLTKILGLPVDDYFLVLYNEEQKEYLRWDEENKKTIIMYFDDNDLLFDDNEDEENEDTKFVNLDDKEYFEGFFQKMRNDGMSDEEILGTLYLMFEDEQLEANQFIKIVNYLGYKIDDEFLNAPLEEQRNYSRWFGEVKENDEINYDIVDDNLDDDLNNYFDEEEE